MNRQSRTDCFLTALTLMCLAGGFFLTQGCASVRPYRGLFVSDAIEPPASGAGLSPPPAEGVRVTYLGTSGYLLEAADANVLVDPYFSRIALLRIALGRPIEPDADRIDAALTRLPQHVDLILVTQGHFDHLLDAPVVARRTGARVIASPTACYLAQAAGLPDDRVDAVEPGSVRINGGVTILAIDGRHDRLFWSVPYPGALDEVPEPPARPSDWVLGTPLAYLIEMGGQRIYIDSSGTTDLLPSAGLQPVDLAILAVALPDSRRRVAATLQRLRPRYFLPNHQDDFFRPLEKDFRFHPLADLNSVRRQVEDRHPPGTLILLDYFEPWTLQGGDRP
jgi:L-ascorbate metabolism protein UlaG (beta-lactamase superfamily)